jgi:hypothetical protein
VTRSEKRQPSPNTRRSCVNGNLRLFSRNYNNSHGGINKIDNNMDGFIPLTGERILNQQVSHCSSCERVRMKTPKPAAYGSKPLPNNRQREAGFVFGLNSLYDHLSQRRISVEGQSQSLQLYDDIQRIFQDPPPQPDFREAKSEGQANGRLEVRRLTVSRLLKCYSDWPH